MAPPPPTTPPLNGAQFMMASSTSTLMPQHQSDPQEQRPLRHHHHLQQNLHSFFYQQPQPQREPPQPAQPPPPPKPIGQNPAQPPIVTSAASRNPPVIPPRNRSQLQPSPLGIYPAVETEILVSRSLHATTPIRTAKSDENISSPPTFPSSLNVGTSQAGSGGLRSIFAFRKQPSPTSPEAPRSQLGQFESHGHETTSAHDLFRRYQNSPEATVGWRRKSAEQDIVFAAPLGRPPEQLPRSPAKTDALLTPIMTPTARSPSPVPSPSSAKVFEQCIKVHSFNGQSHVLDVRLMFTGKAIREAIFKKFRLDVNERNLHVLCRVDEAGRLDIGKYDTSIRKAADTINRI
ncbi:hypothetical protein DFJ73DRAFT_174455 [Zopfochytrium polystomum]|nr:hypothetical protein DFJ73DRAFT_174455 [Zopfochytrium polystomum]